jgi:hypothetical protein
LLCDPQQELHQAYGETWQQLSNNSLEMVRFFATQTLAGGHYLWKRFQDRRTTSGEPQPYQPYLLTNAGSVFVLKPVANREQTAQEHIKQWFNTGLPIADNLLERYALSAEVQNQWQQCPYISQNGYGEVAVNLPIHWELRPQEGDFEPIPEPKGNE